MAALDSVKTALTKNIRQSGIYIAFVLIIALFAVLTDGTLLTAQNITNIVVQNSYILILAIGMVIVIIAGHIDLSVGSVVAFTGAVAGVLIVRMDLPWWIGVIGALVVGALVGAWQGYWVAFVGIPAFIVTLAGMLIFRGATMVTLGNTQISPFPDTFRNIASGFLNGVLGGDGYDLFTLVVAAAGVAAFAFSQFRERRARQRYQQDVAGMPAFIAKIAAVALVAMAFAWQLAHYKGLPVVLLVLGVLVVVYSAVTKRSVFGRHVYAIGGNLNAATLSGIKVKWVNFWIFVNMGVMAAVAGIVFTARLNLANPKAGQNFELDAIAACFIGGAAVTGGVGTVVGAIVGGLIMGVMNNGMSLLGIGIDYQQAIKGLVLLGAVAFDVYNKRRAGVSR
ncbi:multiple monosaccharide ABC transporter permease [Pengzhenrongella frigida]|uniref:Xylose transport system permease protein XylH n=1 Tax=Pengzhenrongella frigida TaxID=1259133 RepID=A0A4Q5MWS2_9MICO|nr:multiple monosaccharide ABC transporter permease [Cellulomonas sp. HLT2-17]RYV50068.1 sugar ABC transporter permease [Cellulomonas sp. HLT2-17]